MSQDKKIKELVNTILSNKDKQGVRETKEIAKTLRDRKLLKMIEEYEAEHFPLTEEEKEAHDLGKDLNLLFRMVEIDVPDSTGWLIYNTIKKWDKMGGKFSIMEASELQAKHKKYFT